MVEFRDILISEIQTTRTVTHDSELYESIRDHGLENPIVVYQHSPNKYRLLDGLRRLQCFKSLKCPVIRARIGNMTDYEYEKLLEPVVPSPPNQVTTPEEYRKHLLKLLFQHPTMSVNEFCVKIGLEIDVIRTRLGL